MGAVPQAGAAGMKALWAIAAYEVRSEMRRISTWVYFGLLFALTFVMMAAMAGTWPDFDLGSRVQLANAPRPLANLIAVISILAVPITSALAGRAVHRDFETRIHPLFFTTPVGKTAYLGGRYLGTIIANLLVFLGIPLGAMAAAAMPFTDADRIGPFRLDAYAAPFALIVIPNVLLTAALFLVLAALTRRVLANQVGGVVLLLGWMVSRLFASAIDEDWVTHLSDPFGAAPLRWAIALLDGGGAERAGHPPHLAAAGQPRALAAGGVRHPGVRDEPVPLRPVRQGRRGAPAAGRGRGGAVAGGEAHASAAAAVLRRGVAMGAAGGGDARRHAAHPAGSVVLDPGGRVRGIRADHGHGAGEHLRDRDLSGDLPGAGAAGRDVRAVPGDHHHHLRRRAGVGGARDGRGADPRRAPGAHLDPVHRQDAGA